MTDLERFIELYKSFGIVLEPVFLEHVQLWEITMKHGQHEKIDGLYAFGTNVTFNAEGKFINQEFVDLS